MPEIMGSGCALLDYDGDGDLDLILLNAGPGSRLYRNELIPSGKLHFTVFAMHDAVQAAHGLAASTQAPAAAITAPVRQRFTQYLPGSAVWFREKALGEG